MKKVNVINYGKSGLGMTYLAFTFPEGVSICTVRKNDSTKKQ